MRISVIPCLLKYPKALQPVFFVDARLAEGQFLEDDGSFRSRNTSWMTHDVKWR